MKIPSKLQDPEFRFFLVEANGKMPIERKWNTENSYPFFHSRLLAHLKAKGNYGVVCGVGSIICLDFDDLGYYNSICNKLPPTFTVQTAKKKLFHLYYKLKGEMFKKLAVLDKEGKVLMDIQAIGSGIIAPGSCIDRKYYNVVNNRDIAEITTETLMQLFSIIPKFPGKTINAKFKEHPLEVEKTMKILALLNVERVTDKHFKCPLHPAVNGANLFINEAAQLHCFHCNRHWFNVFDFAEEVCHDKNTRYIIDIIRAETQWKK